MGRLGKQEMKPACSQYRKTWFWIPRRFGFLLASVGGIWFSFFLFLIILQRSVEKCRTNPEFRKICLDKYARRKILCRAGRWVVVVWPVGRRGREVGSGCKTSVGELHRIGWRFCYLTTPSIFWRGI